jgi:hypothetical protein
MAARVETGEDQDSGVARSSRAGTNRKVNARPISLGWPARIGLVPRIQTLRSPFFSSTVVTVAVDTPESAESVAGSMVIGCSVRWREAGQSPGY